MQISVDWVKELISFENHNIENLIRVLTLAGFEVEEIKEIKLKKKLALEISTTPNRADSLSIKGISTELQSLINQPFKISNYLKQDFLLKNDFSKSFNFLKKKSNYCSFYIGLIVENLININIPSWIKEKLICSGLTPTETLKDFQDYILIETGYPFTFYDFYKIKSHLNKSQFKLSLIKGNANKIVDTKNFETYLLKAENSILSIPGIVSNEKFCINKSTKSIFIEAAIYNPEKIRKQSRTLGIRTEQSIRFEKSLSISFIVEALCRLLLLLKISNPDIKIKLHTATLNDKIVPKTIQLNFRSINQILGTIPNNKYLLPDTISQYLSRLNFKYLFNKDKFMWNVVIPLSRMNDISREIDIIEEIGRLHGFNNFETRLPNLSKIGLEDLSYNLRKKLTSCCLNLGMTEIIEYSLTNKSSINSIKLINPLTLDFSILRFSLLPNLLKTLINNINQGNSEFDCFEYGHIFSYDNKFSLVEKEKMAAVFGTYKTKIDWSDSSNKLSWFEAKAKIEAIFKRLNILIYWKIPQRKNLSIYYHPYKSAEISLINGENFGFFGQINPKFSNKYNLPYHLYLFEINIEPIKQLLKINKLTTYHPYSLYPKITKDLSFFVNFLISFDIIRESIWEIGTQYLIDIKLLDAYTGNFIPKDCQSVCIQLTFQSYQKTLVTKDIEDIIINITNNLKRKFDISLRT